MSWNRQTNVVLVLCVLTSIGCKDSSQESINTNAKVTGSLARTAPVTTETNEEVAPFLEVEPVSVESTEAVIMPVADAEQEQESFHGFRVDERHEDGSVTILCEETVTVPSQVTLVDQDGNSQSVEHAISEIRVRALRIPAGTEDVASFVANQLKTK